MISLEESIRSYPLYKLNEVIDVNNDNYNEEAKEFAKDELILRKIKSLGPLDQIDFIKSLDSEQKNYILLKSFNLYPPHIINIIRKDNNILGIEEPEWFYLDNTTPQGPFKFSELKKLADYNAILPGTLVFRQADQNMVMAATIPGLFSSGSYTPSPVLTYPQNPIPYQIVPQVSNEQSKESLNLGFGLGLICFLIPIIGIIIFFTEKNEKGQNALALALAGGILGVVMYMGMFI